MNRVLSLIITATLLTACAISNEDVGRLSGAAVGGMVGHEFGKGGGQVIATGMGMIIGAQIGGEVGRSMDEADKRHIRDTLEYEPSGKRTKWKNPDSNVTYEVVPERTYYHQDVNGSSQPCREYTTAAVINGKKETVYGTACRNADGSWRIQ